MILTIQRFFVLDILILLSVFELVRLCRLHTARETGFKNSDEHFKHCFARLAARILPGASGTDTAQLRCTALSRLPALPPPGARGTGAAQLRCTAFFRLAARIQPGPGGQSGTA